MRLARPWTRERTKATGLAASELKSWSFQVGIPSHEPLLPLSLYGLQSHSTQMVTPETITAVADPGRLRNDTPLTRHERPNGSNAVHASGHYHRGLKHYRRPTALP